jgi:hypothetical protein
MIHNVPDELTGLLVDIHTLEHLPGNPRMSDVEAIAKSYREFGQLSPIVATRGDGGEIVVLAGNHQLRAARDVLGWTHIAAAVHENLSEEQALAFAALDNHWHTVGGIDDELQYELIKASDGVAADVMDAVGWDDFAMAAMEDVIEATTMAAVTTDDGVGWEAPTIIAPDTNPSPANPMEASGGEASAEPSPEPVRVESDLSDDEILTQGSTAVVEPTRNVKIQYTIVFDTADQQSQWYRFLRFLKESPVYEGETSAEMISAFIAAHSEV